MRSALAIFFALVLHLGFILFGGLLFIKPVKAEGKLQQVDLLSATDVSKDKKPEEPQPQEEKVETSEQAPPDASEIIKSLEQPATNDAPALDAASLGSIEAALNGLGGGGDFGAALNFNSGGRIGGAGRAGGLGEKEDDAFSLAEIDQKPRCVFQASPVYPAEMRGKKVEGRVTLIFIVDPTGRVASVKVEKASHNAFEKPALDALRLWKFEPGVKGGQRVASRMRVSVRFQKS